MNPNTELPNMVNNDTMNQNPIEPKFFQEPVARVNEMPAMAEPLVSATPMMEPVATFEAPVMEVPQAFNPIVNEAPAASMPAVESFELPKTVEEMPKANLTFVNPAVEVPQMNEIPTYTQVAENPIQQTVVEPIMSMQAPVEPTPMPQMSQPDTYIPKFCPNCGNGKENKNFCSNCGCKLI